MLGLFGMSGHWEIFVILFVALLLFGRRVPEIARGIGRSISEFRRGTREGQRELTEENRERLPEPETKSEKSAPLP